MSTPEHEEALATRRRVAVALALLGVFGVVVFVLSRRAPAASPGVAGSAPVAALLASLTEQQRMTSAGRVRARCESGVADPCDCLKAAVREALDASLTESAAALLAPAGGACAEPLVGQAAEVAARSGAPEAAAKAREALLARPADPYATYAHAHLEWMARAPSAEQWAEQAVASGRGAPAHLVVGLAALDRGQLETARRAFGRVLETEPGDAAALYDIALCDHRLGRFGLAREGYLAVLRRNPRHLDARYNLALLVASAGFRPEATHHLAELRKLAPGDPRIANLEKALLAPVAPIAPHVPVTVPSP